LRHTSNRLAKQIDISPDELVPRLLSRSRELGVCLLDSCNAQHAGSQKLIAGIDPIETIELSENDQEITLECLNEILTGDKAAVFTLSYEFGNKLQGVEHTAGSVEPDLFVSVFDSLIIHDYRTKATSFYGKADRIDVDDTQIGSSGKVENFPKGPLQTIRSNFSKQQYLKTVKENNERIAAGDTYQTNLTQQLRYELTDDLSPALVFSTLRTNNPAPFTAFIERPSSTVISASPERFFRVENSVIQASPIKGTRPRGFNEVEDAALRNELILSGKDRAENTMIVDLLRNDLGRVCEYGSVKVTSLCDLQTLPTVLHLVSTIQGKLYNETKPSQIVRAIYPCGSITGAPKISTMRIINELENTPRGLSMGAIGVYVPKNGFDQPGVLDLSVAIRTMVIRDGKATFNVGGGITVESDPEMEYEESWSKATALLDALNTRRPDETF
jgi:para-aminobenzoate synthetase component 1